MQVAIYCIGGTQRTRHVANALAAGIPGAIVLDKFNGVVGSVAIAYGWNHEPVFTAYRAAGKNFVYFDMGYWDRRPEGNKKDGFHRLAVNDWDTAATMLRGMPADRFERSGIELQPWGSKGAGIVVAGMSTKAAGTHGFRPGAWERETAERLRFITRRPIEIRAKPVGDQSRIEPIADVLARSHMLITHHSNAALDAMIAGIPFYAHKGVGKILAPGIFSIETYPEIEMGDRVSLMCDIAYSQWRPSEMRSGEAWEHIKCILRST